jgi:manganese efflux pump family protein
MAPLQLLLVILPLGLDTLGVSLSLGMKSLLRAASDETEKKPIFAYWLRSAMLFSLAEMLMPVVGLVIGYAVSLLLSNVMHYVGSVLLIGVGAWELWEEGREYLHKRHLQNERAPISRVSSSRGGEGGGDGREPLRSPSDPKSVETRGKERFLWRRQLLLALSVSLDELAIGFSLGSITAGKTISPFILCLLIGLQGFLLTIIGLFFGRKLRTRLKSLKEGSELFSALLLIGLGVWLLAS